MPCFQSSHLCVITIIAIFITTSPPFSSPSSSPTIAITILILIYVSNGYSPCHHTQVVAKLSPQPTVFAGSSKKMMTSLIRTRKLIMQRVGIIIEIWQNDEKRPCFALWSSRRSNPRLTPSHFHHPQGRKILEAPAHDKEDDNDDQGSRQEIIKVRTSK